MRIMLVRHGESVANVEKDLGARPGNETLRDADVPLTDLGHDQMIETGRFLREVYENDPAYKGRKLRIIYSPFKRTEQSMKGLLRGLGDSVEIESIRAEPRITEQDFGLFTCVTDPKVAMEHWPEEYAAYQQARKIDKHHARPPGGESRADVVERVTSFVEELRAAKDEKVDVLIVGHGMANRALEMVLNEKDPEWLRKSKNPRNASVRMLDGERGKGYESYPMQQGFLRPHHLPSGYKARAFGAALLPMPLRFA